MKPEPFSDPNSDPDPEARAQEEDLAFWHNGGLGQKAAPRGDSKNRNIISKKNNQKDQARLLFGHVREDSSVETALLKLRPDAKRIFVIASGGCTALSLLAQSDCVVDAVDINKAQIYLCQLKTTALKNLSLPDASHFCLTDAGPLYASVRDNLSSESANYFDRNRNLLSRGLNNAGLIDRRMGTLVTLFYLFVHPQSRVRQFLMMDDLDQELTCYNNIWNNWQWRLALKLAFSKRFLALGFGQAAIDALPDNLSETMAERLKRAFTKFPNRSNRFLWNTMLGTSPPPPEVDQNNSECAWPQYLQSALFPRLQERIKQGSIRWHHDDALNWLKAQDDQSIDLFAISNILEIVKSDYGRLLAIEIARTARSGALICVRAIFPDQPSLMPLIFDQNLSEQLQSIDQSMFCNFIRIYRAQ